MWVNFTEEKLYFILKIPFFSRDNENARRYDVAYVRENKCHPHVKQRGYKAIRPRSFVCGRTDVRLSGEEKNVQVVPPGSRRAVRTSAVCFSHETAAPQGEVEFFQIFPSTRQRVAICKFSVFFPAVAPRNAVAPAKNTRDFNISFDFFDTASGAFHRLTFFDMTTWQRLPTYRYNRVLSFFGCWKTRSSKAFTLQSMSVTQVRAIGSKIAAIFYLQVEIEKLTWQRKRFLTQ